MHLGTQNLTGARGGGAELTTNRGRVSAVAMGGSVGQLQPLRAMLQTRLADASPMRKDLGHQTWAAPAMRLVREMLGA